MSTDELLAALGVIPGYAQAAQAAATLDMHFRQLRGKRLDIGINPVFRHRQQLTRQLIDTALSGQHLPADLTAHDWGQTWKDATRHAQEELLFQALSEATTSAQNHRRHLITQGANAALSNLDDQLQELVGAIRAGQAGGQHADRYSRIRRAQRHIFTEAHHSATRPMLNTVGEMVDLYEHWPRWTKNGKPGSPEPDQPAPWARHGSDPDSSTYTPEYLQWAVDNRAHLWVPTFPQLQAAAVRDNRLREQQDIHRQNVNNGALPRERFTTPDELSLNVFLAEHADKESAHV
ncbi:hypothetical protein [Streptomyces sp. NPDC059165]|uniref:hypothetical protein n=1 Tax=Streptomyces sp. NPDC059165 TaxID=3346751 RepID=UPI0036C2A2B6